MGKREFPLSTPCTLLLQKQETWICIWQTELLKAEFHHLAWNWTGWWSSCCHLSFSGGKVSLVRVFHLFWVSLILLKKECRKTAEGRINWTCNRQRQLIWNNVESVRTKGIEILCYWRNRNKKQPLPDFYTGYGSVHGTRGWWSLYLLY